MQKFIGQVPWDHRPLLRSWPTKSASVGRSRRRAGVRSLGLPQEGDKVGVARQWCGRLGKIDNCQVGIFMGYVSRKEHALVDTVCSCRRNGPRTGRGGRRRGARDDQVPHAARIGAGDARRVRGRLPHGWIAGDDEMGRPSGFRQELRNQNEHYLLAVPSNMLVRDLEAPPPDRGAGTSSRFLSAVGSLGRALPERRGPGSTSATARKVRS